MWASVATVFLRSCTQEVLNNVCGLNGDERHRDLWLFFEKRIQLNEVGHAAEMNKPGNSVA